MGELWLAFQSKSTNSLRYFNLNYYLSGAVSLCFRLSVFLQKKTDPSKMDQTRKFGEQTSRILEFKPEGLDF